MTPIWLSSYPAAVDPNPVIFAGSIGELIATRCQHFGSAEAFRWRGRSMSYEECLAHAGAFAGWLHHSGIPAGRRIALMLPNCLAFPVCALGTLLGGHVLVNVNPRYTARELEYQLLDSGARVLVIWEPVIGALGPVLRPDLLDRVIVVPGDAFIAESPAEANRRTTTGPAWLALAQVLHEGSMARAAAAPVLTTAPALLQYTGGTTGVSKGAILTHRNLLADLAQQAAWFEPFLPEALRPYRAVLPLPLYHIAGFMAGMMRSLVVGGSTLLIENPRDLDGLVATMRTERFTSMSGVNTLYAALLDHPQIGKVDFANCWMSTAGASATQRVVAERWESLTGCPLIEGYGMTETSCYISQGPLDGRRFNGSVGLPYPLTEISIRTPDGEELPPDTAGEICVRGPQVMAGYWQRPEETAEVMTMDGFLRTGDVGLVDAEGYLRISDRRKDMILVSGFNVFPNEVEGVLLTHPKVLEAAVVALPDARSGEVPVAFVVPRDPTLTVSELAVHCASELTPYKRPRHFEICASLPKTTVGKVLRRELRDEARLLAGTKPPQSA